MSGKQSSGAMIWRMYGRLGVSTQRVRHLAKAAPTVENITQPPAEYARVPQDQGNRIDRVVPVLQVHGADDGASEKKQELQKLNGAVWDVPLRLDIAQRVVEWQRACRRTGTAYTKSRGDVTGTTRKPFKQKGTGNARAGDKKAPHHHRGGKAHGAKPRSFAFTLPKQIRKLGLKVALSARLAESRLCIVHDLSGIGPKTKNFKEMEEALVRTSTASKNTMLLILGNNESSSNLTKAAGNLQGVEVLPARAINVLSILRRQSLVLTPVAVQEIENRLLLPIRR